MSHQDVSFGSLSTPPHMKFPVFTLKKIIVHYIHRRWSVNVALLGFVNWLLGSLKSEIAGIYVQKFFLPFLLQKYAKYKANLQLHFLKNVPEKFIIISFGLRYKVTSFGTFLLTQI